MHPTEPTHALPRRPFLGLALATAVLGAPGLAASAAQAAQPASDEARAGHFPFKPVLPRRPAPALPLRTHADASTPLAALLMGRISAVQLMFTGCSATCPIQGALFAQAQAELGAGLQAAQFVSLSIDPLADGPAALSAWLRRLSAKTGWTAAAPRVQDVDRLIAWLGEGGEPRPRGNDPHTGQVYIVNQRGELVYRTPSMPPVAAIVAALRRVAAQA